MGTAHVEARQQLVDKIKDRQDVTILEITNFGEGFFMVKLESDILPEGYNGLQNLFFENDQIRFRRDVDT